MKRLGRWFLSRPGSTPPLWASLYTYKIKDTLDAHLQSINDFESSAHFFSTLLDTSRIIQAAFFLCICVCSSSFPAAYQCRAGMHFILYASCMLHGTRIWPREDREKPGILLPSLPTVFKTRRAHALASSPTGAISRMESTLGEATRSKIEREGKHEKW